MSMQFFGTRFQLSLGDIRLTVGFSIDSPGAQETPRP